MRMGASIDTEGVEKAGLPNLELVFHHWFLYIAATLNEPFVKPVKAGFKVKGEL